MREHSADFDTLLCDLSDERGRRIRHVADPRQLRNKIVRW